MSLAASKGERLAAATGVIAGLVIVVICLDLALDGRLLGWLAVPASSATEAADDDGD